LAPVAPAAPVAPFAPVAPVGPVTFHCLKASLELQSATEWKFEEIRTALVVLFTHALIVGTAALVTPDTPMTKAAAMTTEIDHRNRWCGFGAEVIWCPLSLIHSGREMSR
jgi:hypothetical protein